LRSDHSYNDGRTVKAAWYLSVNSPELHTSAYTKNMKKEKENNFWS